MNERPSWYLPAMNSLLAKVNLDQPIMSQAIHDLTHQNIDEAFAASFLVALRFKGETATEIAAAAQVLRDSMVTINCKNTDTPIVDTCGTGGDDSGTFNISTAAAIITAASGIGVVKHGNRAVSGKTGSADVLQMLGLPIDSGVAWSQSCLEKFNFAFCFAPLFHPSMAKITPLRKKLGIRTVFNLLGPLTNPARAKFQVIGVGKIELLKPLAEAVRILGTERTVLVHGSDGLDEVTISGPTSVMIVENNSVREMIWVPSDFGIEPAKILEIQADTVSASVNIIRKILDGEHGPARRFVLANAATAIWTCGKANTLREAVTVAEQAIDNGEAKKILTKLVIKI